MNKREFLKFMRNELNNTPLGKKTFEINRYISYLMDLKETYKKSIDKKSKTHILCDFCRNFFKKNPKEYKTKEYEVKGACISWDSGYGDDDILADVTYTEVYVVCPFCKSHILLQTFKSGVKNRRTRR